MWKRRGASPNYLSRKFIDYVKVKVKVRFSPLVGRLRPNVPPDRLLGGKIVAQYHLTDTFSGVLNKRFILFRLVKYQKECSTRRCVSEQVSASTRRDDISTMRRPQPMRALIFNENPRAERTLKASNDLIDITRRKFETRIRLSEP